VNKVFLLGTHRVEKFGFRIVSILIGNLVGQAFGVECVIFATLLNWEFLHLLPETHVVDVGRLSSHIAFDALLFGYGAELNRLSLIGFDGRFFYICVVYFFCFCFFFDTINIDGVLI